MRAETAPIQHLFYIPKRVSQRIFALKKYRKSTEKVPKKYRKSTEKVPKKRRKTPLPSIEILIFAQNCLYMRRRFWRPRVVWFCVG